MVNLSTYCSMATSGWDSRSKKMCCWAKMPDQSSYAEMHKSEIVKDLVKNLQEGVRNPICQDCWQMEDVGSKSMRQQRLENKTIDTLEEEIKSQKIKHLVIDSGTQCNFACRTCGPWSSTGHYKEFEKLTGKIWQDNAIRSTDVDALLQHDLSSVESIEVLGGEPFLNLDHLKVIEKINQLEVSNKCILSYSTNGSVKLRPDILQTFNKFKSVNISLSIDAIGKQFDYIRTLGKWDSVSENVKTLLKYRESYTNLSVSGHPTISALNVLYVDDLFAWFENNRMSYTVVFCTDPQEYSMDIFDQDRRMKILEYLNNNPTKYKMQIAKHIATRKYSESALDQFFNAVKFTEEYRKLSAKDYIPKLIELLGN